MSKPVFRKMRDVSAPVNGAERLSAADLIFHARIIRKRKEAEKAVAEINRLQQFVIGVNGAAMTWWEQLTESYGLTPGVDRVEEDGSIVRGKPQEPPNG